MREEAIRTAKIRFDDALQRVARSLTSSTKTNGERIGVVGTDGNALGDGETPSRSPTTDLEEEGKERRSESELQGVKPDASRSWK